MYKKRGLAKKMITETETETETVWLHRQHQVPPPVHIHYSRIRRRYMDLLDDGVFPTEDDMDHHLRVMGIMGMHAKTMSTISKTMSKTMSFMFKVPNVVADTTLATESLQQYVKDLKPGEGGEVRGEACAKARCVVCQEWGAYKIGCGHVFHKECIHECAKWKNECPVCQAPLITSIVL